MTSQGALKTPCKTVRTVGHTIRILKDIIVIMVSRTKPFLIFLLLLLKLQEQGFDVWEQLIGAFTTISFGRVLFNDMGTTYNCVINTYGIILAYK